VRPGATEVVADGVDQDCDGGDTCYVDADGDAYGDAATVPSADTDCADVGEAEVAEDCDDTDAAVSPEAVERPADGVDSDCDGLERCAADTDGDGYGAATGAAWSTDLDCADDGESATTDDCDDADAAVNPGATETVADRVDGDCDGTERCWSDADGDGYAACAECDDTNADAFPGAEEICNGQDDDCDPTTRDRVDGDGDGLTTCGGDCDDTRPDITVGSDEVWALASILLNMV
jgi:hypothetical protein